MKNLSPEEINELLNPQKKDKPFIITRNEDGSITRTALDGNPPSITVGGYIGKAGETRKYVSNETVLAYRSRIV